MNNFFSRIIQETSIKELSAVLVLLFGIVLCFCGFWVNPMGVIDNSVLYIFAECLCYVGSIFGIGCYYYYKNKEFEKKINDKLDGK